MDLSIYYKDSTPLFRCINYILDTVDKNGSWGGRDFEDWRPIITALTLELLLTLGFSPETEWLVVRGTKMEHASLLSTIKFLNLLIKEDGSFGEDLWDGVRLGKIIEHNDLEDRFANYPKLKKYILDSVQQRSYMDKDSTWSGPGTMAALIDYLDAAKEQTKADEIFANLLTLQLEDGSFHGPVNEVNDGIVHPIWHTTIVLMTSLRRIPSEKDERIQKMVNFICSTQDKEKGCWRAFSHFGVYFTAYAIIGLNKLTSKPRENIQIALSWLSSQVSEIGKIRDSGGTIMGAMALRSEFSDQPVFQASIAELRHLGITENAIKDLNNELLSLKEELSVRNRDLDTYKKKFDLADIVLTKKEAFIFTLFFAVILALVGFIPQVISLIKEKPTIPEQHIAKEQLSTNEQNLIPDTTKSQSKNMNINDNGIDKNTKKMNRNLNLKNNNKGSIEVQK